MSQLVFWFLTINFVCVCWILFRARTFTIASVMIKRYLFLSSGGPSSLPGWLLALPPGLLALQLLLRKLDVFDKVSRLPLALFGMFLGAFVALLAALLPFGYKPFIYFQF
jgi:alginate O-acetyltransferase complex protein AlgI